ncbi:hypothetical protein ACJD0Z_04155 [Flavobacteriaceae bacterium M23B6Z8]
METRGNATQEEINHAKQDDAIEGYKAINENTSLQYQYSGRSSLGNQVAARTDGLNFSAEHHSLVLFEIDFTIYCTFLDEKKITGNLYWPGQYNIYKLIHRGSVSAGAGASFEQIDYNYGWGEHKTFLYSDQNINVNYLFLNEGASYRNNRMQSINLGLKQGGSIGAFHVIEGSMSLQGFIKTN